MPQKPRLLVVDDEQNILNSLQRFFKFKGYEVVTCLSGEKALEVLGQSPPFSVIISDYRMPGMNGVDFLKSARNLCPHTVRIVLSGFADLVAIISAVNEGSIFKFIAKPWNDEELHTTIQDAVEYYNAKIARQDALSSMETNHLQQSPDFQLYKSLFEGMPVGFVGINSNNNIRIFNEYAGKALNISNSVIGASASTALPPELFDQLKRPGSEVNVHTFHFTFNNRGITCLEQYVPDYDLTGLTLIVDQ